MYCRGTNLKKLKALVFRFMDHVCCGCRTAKSNKIQDKQQEVMIRQGGYLVLKKPFCFALLAAVVIKAQSGYNYYEWGGSGAGYQRGYTNIKRQFNDGSFNLNFIYNYNRYLPIELEAQAGRLSGGSLLPSQDPYGREYVNNYKALILHADFQLGTSIDYLDNWFLTIVKGFYGGTGIGLVSNDNKVQCTNVILANGPLTYVFPGADKGVNVDWPLRFGYEFKIYDSYNQPSLAVDLGYIHSFVFYSGPDGYNDPRAIFKHNAEDQYLQFTIMVKYYIGNVTSYNKLMREFR